MKAWHGWTEAWLVAFLVLIPLSATVGPASLNVQWSDLAAGGFLISCAAGGWRRARGRPALLGWAGAVYLASQLPSFLQAAHPTASWIEFVKTGYVVGLGLAIAGWIKDPATWDRLTAVFAAVVGALVVVSLGVFGYTRWSGHVPGGLAVLMPVPNVGEVLRVKATLYTPTLLANYLTMGVPLLAGYAAARSPWPRATSWGILLSGMLAAATTASHSLAGYLVAAAVMAPRKARLDRIGQRIVSGLAAAVIVFALGATTVSVYGIQAPSVPASNPPAAPAPHDFLGPQGTGEELTVRVRYAWVVYGLLKRFAWEAWQRHPWIGIGLGEFPHEVTKAFEAGRIHAYYAAGHDPHSTWLGAMAETGLIGLTGLLGLWLALLSMYARAHGRLHRSPDGWRVLAPFAGLVGLAVNSPHVDIMHFRFLWVGAALLVAAVGSGSHS